MKRKWIIVVAIIVIVIIAMYSFFTSNYNKMVTMNEGVQQAWSNVENQYQRRSDLIPNLVNTVKGYASHESETLQAVVEARAKATQITVNVDDVEDMARFNKAQSEVSSALSRLLAVSENYPDLKANQNFLELQAQLEGTENRISTERRKFNEDVKTYNSFIKAFPRVIVANMFDFDAAAYFNAEDGAETAPKVQF